MYWPMGLLTSHGSVVGSPGKEHCYRSRTWNRLQLCLSLLCNEVTELSSGKKRGATVRLSNVTVNAPSVLKHEEELESLAALMPADCDARRK